MECSISQKCFLPCTRAHSYAPVIIEHVHAMNDSSQAHNVLRRAKVPSRRGGLWFAALGTY